jgi:gamma-glutamyltranspeptidase / glutathione hydrolase
MQVPVQSRGRFVSFNLSLLVVVFFFLFSNVVRGHAGYAVVTAHPLATKAGERILQQGGNAFDAAVAVGAVLAVVEPYASGLGGGGFWLLHRASDQFEIMIDGRETAPERAHAAMYLDQAGQPDQQASLRGALAAAIPGTPAALAHIAEKYGRLPLTRSLAPAIQLARSGFAVDERLAKVIINHQEKLTAEPSSTRVFLPKGQVPSPGELFRQPLLADTLSQIARNGRDGFYQGAVAAELVRAVKKGGGIWTIKDLAGYRVVERQPIRFTYRDARITTASLPSSGGLTLAQALNILERFPLNEMEKTEQSHVVVEAMRRAYEDRANYLGDSDFVEVDVEKLLSKDYALHRAATINMNKATQLPPRRVNPKEVQSDSAVVIASKAKQPSSRSSLEEVGLSNETTFFDDELVRQYFREGVNTTHFSIMDDKGNRVAATLSINTFFGSGFVAGNTGVLLNNEMDDFSIALNVPNVYGLHGGKANAIAPGKRPLSSMSPTFLENEQGILIAGTPGGSRIISALLLLIIEFVDQNQTDSEKLVVSPRFHHQYLPDEIMVEPNGFDVKWKTSLETRGHNVKTSPRRWGNMQLIFFDNLSRKKIGAGDPRGGDYVRY